MKKFLSILIIAVFTFTSMPVIVAEAKSTTVKSYRKKNGTYVRSHTRKVATSRKSSSGRKRK